MVNKYDVIIVGAGQAGLLAAKAAGEIGLNVALLEKKSDPAEHTRACGETLVSFNEYYLGMLARYNARDQRICFSPYGLSFKYDGPYRNLYCQRRYVTNGHIIDFGDYEQQKKLGDYGRVGLSYDKGRLLQCLLEDIRSCSVDIFPGVAVDKVVANKDGVIVEGSGQSFEGIYAIAADGVNSRIAQIMGMNKDRTFYCNYYAKSYYMSGMDLQEPPEMIITSSGFVREGAVSLFIIPRFNRGEYNVLVTTMNPNVDIDTGLDYFMNKPLFSPWFKKSKVVKEFAAAFNLYSPIIEPYDNRVLIVGDAGSCVDLENTGAMISGWKAGQAVSTAIQEENLGLEVLGINQYVDWWKEEYIRGHDHDDMMRGVGLSLILSTEEEISYLNSFIKETLPATWHPSAAGKHAGRAMANAWSTIEKERPDIYQKLQKRKLPATEIYAELTRICKPI